jgi:regulator of sigma E protease
MVAHMITGEVSLKNMSGPLSIADIAGSSADAGLAAFLSFLAAVSISLGILNLLPIPLLDGGQIVYQVVEWIKGSPLSERAMLIGQQIGIFFVIALTGFAFYNDIVRIFGS